MNDFDSIPNLDEVQNLDSIGANGMSLFQNILGVMSSDFIIGGPSGIMLRKTSTGLEVRNSDGSALVKITASEVNTDTINESTLDAGVTVEGVLIKDSLVDGKDVSGLAEDADVVHNSGNETISGTKDFTGEVDADTINESTLDAGVTIESVLIKDGLVDGMDVSALAEKTYVDSIAQGIQPHAAVKVATTEALPAVTPSGSKVDKILTADAFGILTIDGVAVAHNERVLIKDQVNPIDNGVYTLTTVGDAETAFVLTRAVAEDGMPDVELASGDFFFVTSGTENGNSGFIVTNPPSGLVDVDVTAINFTQFSGAGQIIDGAGLSKDGNILNVNVDDSTIEINGNDTLQVKASGITDNELADDSVTAEKINADVAGDGLVQDSLTGALNVNVDGTTLVLGNDTLSISDTLLGTLAVDAEVVHNSGNETISGTKDFTGEIDTDTINESTLDAGVTIEGILIKDGLVAFTPDGDIEATDMQSAIEEVRNDTDTKLVGTSRFIKVPVALSSVNSTVVLPEGSIVKSVTTRVTSNYSNGATLQVLANGSSPLVLQDIGENYPQISNIYKSEPVKDISSSNSGVVRVVVTGTPVAGTADVIVEYIPSFQV